MSADELLSRSPSESRGLLLRLARKQAAARAPRDVLRQWSRDATVRPSAIDLRTTVTLDALALEAAADYEGVLLSPVAPLGTNSVVAPTSQDRTLTTTRSTEVVSDPTNVLALDCAKRLALDPSAHVRLCTSHQILRMQGVPHAAGRSQHFRLFALADAGPARPDDGFEVEAIAQQLTTYDRIFDGMQRRGHRMAERRLIVRSSAERGTFGERVVARLGAVLPDVPLERRPLESNYYQGLRVGFGAVDLEGEFQEVVDLGVFDWVATLTSNRRHRFVASAIGIQLLPLLF